MKNVKDMVRSVYASLAGRDPEQGDGCSGGGCCGPTTSAPTAADMARGLGYSDTDVTSAPPGSNLGLGCGNPQAIADLKPGEAVLDLGSGAGFDCFLAAGRVGERGHVIGVDMTPEMLAKARQNAEQAGAANVEFRLGEIESLPVADNSVDVVISNCVINLSPDKKAVYEEAARVLKCGGRLAVADIVARKTLPEEIRRDLALHAGCVAGAATIQETRALLEGAGFVDILIEPREVSREIIDALPEGGFERFVVAANIKAKKPLAPSQP